LGQALRIPCYEGWSPVLLTYCGFVRPIRGVVQVARTLGASAVGKQRLLQPQSGYRYSNRVVGGASLVAFSVLLRSERSAPVIA
jgi:hypothetical protein